MSGGGGDCVVMVGCDVEATFYGGGVAYMCGDSVVDVDACGGGCEFLGSMSIPVFTSRSSICWTERGESKEVCSLSKLSG